MCTCTAPTLELPFDTKFAVFEYYYEDEYDITVYEDIGSVDVCVLGGATAVPVVLGISDYYCGMEYSDSACGKCAPGTSIIATLKSCYTEYRIAGYFLRAPIFFIFVVNH